jgi:hypothetical protein
VISSHIRAIITVARWWGYTSQFNLLDYPCVVIPAGFADKEKDKKDYDYEPTNEKDKENYELCMVLEPILIDLANAA